MAEIVAARRDDRGRACRSAVALKRHPHRLQQATRSSSRAFFDEVRLAMQLSHANVVQVFDFGPHRGQCVLPGDGIRRGRRTCKRLRAPARRRPAASRRGAARRRADVARPGLRAPPYRQRQPPAWASFTWTSSRPTCWCRFEGRGEADRLRCRRRFRATCARPMVGISGTIPFMSPETGRAEKPVDLRSDVFSAGVLLYALLAGRVARSARRTPVRRSTRSSSAATARPRAWTSMSGFDPLLERALALRPDDRFAKRGARSPTRSTKLMFRPGLARRRRRPARSVARRVFRRSAGG